MLASAAPAAYTAARKGTVAHFPEDAGERRGGLVAVTGGWFSLPRICLVLLGK